MQFTSPNSQWYLVNANLDTNHSANPTNPSGNPNPINPTDPGHTK